MVGGEAGPRQEGLDAAAPTAVARRVGQRASPRAGISLWPHSPAIAFAPVQTWPSNDDAAADPGAEDHAEHEPVAAPAPSVASESAKQLASFSTRTSRASASAMSLANGCPFSTVELAFLIRPLAARHRARRADADPARRPSFCSRSATRPWTASTICR
jgi:hypothetical protein